MQKVNDHNGSETMTVEELISLLKGYPPTMPVFAEWEGVTAYVKPDNFSVQLVSKKRGSAGYPSLVVWVEEH